MNRVDATRWREAKGSTAECSTIAEVANKERSVVLENTSRCFGSQSYFVSQTFAHCLRQDVMYSASDQRLQHEQDSSSCVGLSLLVILVSCSTRCPS